MHVLPVFCGFWIELHLGLARSEDDRFNLSGLFTISWYYSGRPEVCSLPHSASRLLYVCWPIIDREHVCSKPSTKGRFARLVNKRAMNG